MSYILRYVSCDDGQQVLDLVNIIIICQSGICTQYRSRPSAETRCRVNQSFTHGRWMQNHVTSPLYYNTRSYINNFVSYADSQQASQIRKKAPRLLVKYSVEKSIFLYFFILFVSFLKLSLPVRSNLCAFMTLTNVLNIRHLFFMYIFTTSNNFYWLINLSCFESI